MNLDLDQHFCFHTMKEKYVPNDHLESNNRYMSHVSGHSIYNILCIFVYI